MKEKELSVPSYEGKFSYTFVIPVLKQVLSEGFVNYTRIDTEVRTRIESKDGRLSEGQWRNAWSKALTSLEKSKEILRITIKEIRPIPNALKENVRDVLDTLQSSNDRIIEAGLRQLSILSKDQLLPLNQQIIESLERLVSDLDQITSTFVIYYLMSCDNILGHLQQYEPGEYDDNIKSLNKCVGLFYQKIDCKTDKAVLEQALNLVPKNSRSYRILDTVFSLIECLPDDLFDHAYKYKIKWILFDQKHRIAKQYKREINTKLTNMIKNQSGKLGDRAYFLLSHKSEEIIKNL